jgi:transcription initiation factor TFIIIB Brf1 subunit/transcription initiation factor TFIIB
MADTSTKIEGTLIQRCNLCGGIVRADRGFIVCYGCGDVKDRELRQGIYAEGLSDVDYTPAQYVNIGNKPNIVSGNGSEIGFHRQRFRDRQFVKMKLIHQDLRMQSPTIFKALQKINHVCGVLLVPNIVRNRACTIMRQALPAWDGIRTNNILILALGSLAVAVKLHRIPILDSEIMDVWRPDWRDKPLSNKVTGTNMNRAKFFLKNTVGISFSPLKAIHFIPRVISSFRKSGEILARLENKSIDPDEYFKKLEYITRKVLYDLESNSRSPLTLAASCCYTFDPARPQLKKIGVLTHRTIAEALENPGLEHVIRDHHIEFWKPILLNEVEE